MPDLFNDEVTKLKSTVFMESFLSAFVPTIITRAQENSSIIRQSISDIPRRESTSNNTASVRWSAIYFSTSLSTTSSLCSGARAYPYPGRSTTVAPSTTCSPSHSVHPGVLDTFAILPPTSRFSRDDLPAFDRPIMATSGLSFREISRISYILCSLFFNLPPVAVFYITSPQSSTNASLELDYFQTNPSFPP